jgi:hypothetical protein
MDRQIAEVQSLATKYSKSELGRMVSMGLLDPQKAMMAGMMIDRIQKQNAQPPQTTVAEDVLGLPGMAEKQQQMQPQPAGVEALPAGNVGEYAGGGIVAFADGGEADAPGYAGDRGSWVIDPKVQRQRDMQWRLPILKQELQEAQARGNEADVAAIQREIRRLVPRADADAGIGALVPSVQAAETQTAAPATDTSAETSSPLGRGMKKLFRMGESTTNAARAYQTGVAEYDKRIAEVSNKIGELSGPLGLRQQTQEQKAEFEQLMKDRQVLMNARNNLAQDIAKYNMIAPSKPGAAAPGAAAKPDTSIDQMPLPDEIGTTPKGGKAPPSAEAPAQPAEPSFPGVMKGLKAETIPLPKEKSITELAQEQEEADKLMGVDKDVFNKLRQDYKKMGGKFAERKDRAAGMALMMFGAGLIGARRGQEAQAVSRFGQQALIGYMGAMEKINENEDKLDEKLRDLSLAEQTYLRTKSEKALSEKRALERDIRGVQAKNAELTNQVNVKGAEFTVDWIKNNNPPLYQTLNRIAQDQRDAGNKGFTTLDALKDYQGVAKTGEVSRDKAFQEWSGNIMLQSKYPDFESYWAGYKRSMGGGATGGPVDKNNPLLRP